jgi:hypothetical protein
MDDKIYDSLDNLSEDGFEVEDQTQKTSLVN